MTYRYIHIHIHIQVDALAWNSPWMNGRTNAYWVARYVDGWMDGSMDPMDAMDGRMDKKGQID